MREGTKTALFAGAALALAIAAALVEPERRTPSILSDQGAAFYPKFSDPQAARTIEVVDYDEATATARPFSVEFQKGRWVLPTHSNYPLDAGERLAKTAAALIDLRRDIVTSDAVPDQGKYGVIDPLDAKAAELKGRGKRVTLRDARKEVLADFIFGRAVEGKPGYRYVRLPGQKRIYAVKTDADPSARFADWVNAAIVRVSAGSIRRVIIQSYSIDEASGRLANMDTIQLTKEGGAWKMAGAGKLNSGVMSAMESALENLKIVDAKPKPPSLAADLKEGRFQLSLEAAVSLRQRGFFVTPNGRLLANEGEMIVETQNGLAYAFRFGEIAIGEGAPKTAAATGGENRYLFATVNFDAARAAKYGDTSGDGERQARSLNARMADWYYVISGSDFLRLRPKRKDLTR